jgi:hypothetical protein
MRSTVVRCTVIGVSAMVATAAAMHSQGPNGVFVPSIPRTVGRSGPFDPRSAVATPYTTYVIRTRGTVELGNNACSFCHTRAMPDGTVIRGAQGNFPFDRALAYVMRRRSIHNVRTGFRTLFAAPWLKDADPAARVAAMTLEELVTTFDAIPPGVAARHRGSIDSPPAIPDLIGVREQRYLDRTAW